MKRAAALFALALGACVVPPKPAPATPGQAPLTEVRVSGGAVDGERWLAPDAQRAAAAGAGKLVVLGADVATEGVRIASFVEIPEAACALVFTRASASIADVDLFAYDDDGSTFAADESPDRDAAVLVCPPHPRRLYVVARVSSGSGVVGVGVQMVPKEAADGVAKIMGVRGRPGEDTGRLDSWPGLEARIRAHRDALGGRWEEARRVALPVSPRIASRVSATVDAGRCLDVLVVPSDEIPQLDVAAEDEAARVIARARDRGKDRSVLLCAARAATVSLSARSRGAQGLAAVILSRSAPGAEPEAGAHAVHLAPAVELAEARAAVATQLGSLAYAAPRTVASGQARLGTRTAIDVDLPAGCARLDVIVGKPFAELAASLWDDRGALLAEASAGGSAPLFACGKGGRARLDLEPLASPGPYVVELRRDKAAPAALLAHPRAAARLLARLAAAGLPEGAAAASSAVVLPLEENQRRSVPLLVPPSGGCVEVIAALDAGAGGLDLRIADPAGDGAVTRAHHVVADRLCGPASGKPGAAELRVLSGKADALVLVRPLGSN